MDCGAYPGRNRGPRSGIECPAPPDLFAKLSVRLKVFGERSIVGERIAFGVFDDISKEFALRLMNLRR